MPQQLRRAVGATFDTGGLLLGVGNAEASASRHFRVARGAECSNFDLQAAGAAAPDAGTSQNLPGAIAGMRTALARLI